MWFVYIDESKENNDFFVYSALIVDSDQWSDAFKALRDARKRLRDRRGVFMSQELHAWKFAAGKGQIANRPILRPERAEIFRRVLSFTAETNLFRVISSVNKEEFYAFDRLINRINRTAKEHNKKVLLICDEGQKQSSSGDSASPVCTTLFQANSDFGAKLVKRKTYPLSKS